MTADIIPTGPPDPLLTAWHDTSDLGNGKRLVAIADGRLLWLEDVEAFIHFDGRRWKLERGGIEAQRLAHRVIEHIDAEAEALGEIADNPVALQERVGRWCTPEIATDRIKTLRAHAVRSGSAGMTQGMLRQARSMLAATLDDFDRDPLIYNVGNGTLRFVESDTGWRVAISPHEPRDMITCLADVDYLPDAPCDFWLERLAMLTPDAEQLAALRPLYGYTLTGLTSDQAFYVHQGKGGDGKSVTHMALAELHGDYYRHAGVGTFLQASGQKAGSEHRSDLVRLKGDVRFVTCDEPPPRAVWDGQTIKQITGSMITARGVNARTEETFRPRFKLHAECNVIPRAPSDDKGFRRRFKLFQWTVSVDATPAGAMPIDVVMAKVSRERSGILNWLVAGALEWLATRTIPQPAAMAAVLSDFWADSSPLLEWMGEWCDTSDPTAKTPAKDLYSHFKTWCEEGGREQIMSSTAFGRSLRDKQHASWKDPKGNRFRLGIRLRADGLYVGPGGPAGPVGPGRSREDRPAVNERGESRGWGGEDDDMPP